MALKAVKNKENSSSKSSSTSDIKTISIRGKAVSRYVDAKALIEKADKEIKEVEGVLKTAASDHVFTENCEAGRAVTKSVKITDDTGAKVRVTLAAQYSAMPEDVATKLFEVDAKKINKAKKPDVNDYVIQVRRAKFDSAVFIVNDEFSDNVYKAFLLACATVAERFNVANPLSTEIVNVVRPTFDNTRYADFDRPSQSVIYEVLPNKTSISVVPSDE